MEWNEKKIVHNEANFDLRDQINMSCWMSPFLKVGYHSNVKPLNVKIMQTCDHLSRWKFEYDACIIVLVY